MTALVSAAVMILFGYATLLGGVAAAQRRLIFRPDRSLGERWLEGGPGEAMTVAAADGTALRCWYLPPAAPTAPVLLYLHGNGGHIGYRAERIAAFARLGWGALVMGYRGYGGTGGAPSERALAGDAHTCLTALRQAAGASRTVLVWGESLGCGIAAPLAADPAARVDGLVLEAPFTSLAALIRGRMRWVRPALPLLRDRFDVAAAVAALRCPLFILAGDRDEVVPIAMPRALYAAAHEPKRMLVLPATHDALGTPAAFAAVAAFFDPRPPGAGVAGESRGAAGRPRV